MTPRRASRFLLMMFFTPLFVSAGNFALDQDLSAQYCQGLLRGRKLFEIHRASLEEGGRLLIQMKTQGLAPDWAPQNGKGPPGMAFAEEITDAEWTTPKRKDSYYQKTQILTGHHDGYKIALGQIAWNRSQSTITASWIDVADRFQRNGISDLLWSRLLELETGITGLNMELVDTNLARVLNHLGLREMPVVDPGLSPQDLREAIRSTPAYLSLSKFGFTRIRNIDFSDDHFSFQLLRP